MIGNYETCNDGTKEGHIFIFNDIALFCGAMDKQKQYRVEFSQVLEGICFAKQTVRDEDAICFQHHPNGSSFMCIWSKEQKMDILSILTSLKSKGSLKGSNTVPVMANSPKLGPTKAARRSISHQKSSSPTQKFTPPRMSRASSSFDMKSQSLPRTSSYDDFDTKKNRNGSPELVRLSAKKRSASGLVPTTKVPDIL